jgi:hypothetical protein
MRRRRKEYFENKAASAAIPNCLFAQAISCPKHSDDLHSFVTTANQRELDLSYLSEIESALREPPRKHRDQPYWLMTLRHGGPSARQRWPGATRRSSSCANSRLKGSDEGASHRAEA